MIVMMGSSTSARCVVVATCRESASPARAEDDVKEVSDISAVAHVIQLAIAPVFLLSSIGAMLAVMTNRLARVIDRARLIEGRVEAAAPEHAETMHETLDTLARRAKLIGRAITACVTTALLVCTIIAILFLGAFLHFDPSIPVALLFIVAMFLFVLGLVYFLREIFLATARLKIGLR